MPVLKLQDNNPHFTPQWVIDCAPKDKGDDVLLRTSCFKEPGTYIQNASNDLDLPTNWTPSNDCLAYIDDKSNWTEHDANQLTETSETTDHLNRRTVLQQINDFKLKECCKACFPTKSIWKFSDLERGIADLGTKFHFVMSYSGNNFVCNKSKKKTSAGSLRTNCKFAIKLSFLFSLGGDKDHGKGRNRRKEYDNKHNRDALCMITSVDAQHNHSREKTDHAAALRRSGKINKTIPKECIQTLLLYVKQGVKLSIDLMRAVLLPAFPTSYIFTASEISNIRRKLYAMYQTMSSDQIVSFEEFENAQKSNDLEGLLGGSFNHGTSASSQKSRTILEEFRKRAFYSSPHGNMNNDNVKTSFKNYPKNSIVSINDIFKSTDPYFDYCLDVSRDTGTIKGIAWQTGAMRNNFSRYGSYISIDVCKRDYCTLGLYYISVSLRRADGSICLAIEALVETESIPTYRWLIKCLFEMSANDMTRESIYIVAADQAISQTNITNDFLLPNANLIMDWWHLENKNFPENFKGGRYDQIKVLLKNLLTARSDLEFVSVKEKISSGLRALSAPPVEHNYLEAMCNKRRYFSQYKLNETFCSFGLHGSTASETNHSSIFSHFGDEYHEHPVRFQSDLMNRELYFQKTFEIILVKERSELQFVNEQEVNRLLKIASANIDNRTLNLSGYHLLKREIVKAQYLSRNENEDGSTTIGQIKDNVNYTYCFPTKESRCRKCVTSQSYDFQCAHEIANDPSFKINFCNQRYRYQSCLTLTRRRKDRCPIKIMTLDLNENEDATTAPSDNNIIPATSNATSLQAACAYSIDGCNTATVQALHANSHSAVDTTNAQALGMDIARCTTATDWATGSNSPSAVDTNSLQAVGIMDTACCTTATERASSSHSTLAGGTNIVQAVGIIDTAIVQAASDNSTLAGDTTTAKAADTDSIAAGNAASLQDTSADSIAYGNTDVSKVTTETIAADNSADLQDASDNYTKFRNAIHVSSRTPHIIQYNDIVALSNEVAGLIMKLPMDYARSYLGFMYGVRKIHSSSDSIFPTTNTLENLFKDYASQFEDPVRESSRNNSEDVAILPIDPPTLHPAMQRTKKRILFGQEYKSSSTTKRRIECSFCKGDHKSNSHKCTKRIRYQTESKEFQNLSDLESTIKSSALVGLSTTNANIRPVNDQIFKLSTGSHSAKHFIIHSVHPKNDTVPNHNELRYLDLCVTGINENGDIVQSIEQQAVCASVFMDKALRFNNKRRIFDQTGMCEASSDGFRDRGSIINANLMM